MNIDEILEGIKINHRPEILSAVYCAIPCTQEIVDVCNMEVDLISLYRGVASFSASCVVEVTENYWGDRRPINITLVGSYDIHQGVVSGLRVTHIDYVRPGGVT